MEHYKSWGALKKWLEGNLCDDLRGRIGYFLTRYHDVHDAYGRAAVLVDGEEWVVFTWMDSARQERDLDGLWTEGGKATYDTERFEQTLKPKWDEACTYSENDFLLAVLQFRNMSVGDALQSDDFLVKMLAILDKRVGVRTLKKLKETQAYLQYPEWVRRFYALRIDG